VTAGEFFLTAWDFEPSVIAGCAVMTIGYFLLNRARPADAIRFCAGVIAIALALMSPLDALADRYLFSAHMLQHLILLMVAPPLLIAGLTAEFSRELVRRPLVGAIEKSLSRPPVSFAVGVGAMAVWHLPAMYNAAVASEAVHVIEHLCFLVSATIFWWPVFTPLDAHRLSGGAAMLYLGAGALAGSAIGIAITFASPAAYPAYLAPRDEFGIIGPIRDRLGLTPELDLQLGGLLMWVGGGLIFLSMMVVEMARWYRNAERARSAPTPYLAR
jgi:cytochrome c oxidase assembly factor CtaG